MATPHSPRPKNHTKPSQRHSIAAYLLLGIVHFYRYVISPLLAPRCRFYPTCSQYTLEAIRTYGAFKGSWLAFKRILRCNPLSKGGEDPVPSCCEDRHKNQ